MSSQYAFFKWHPWARLQTMTAEVFILMGAITLFFYPNSLVTFTAKYGQLGASIAFILLEYQTKFTIPFLWTNFWVKGIILFAQAAAGMLTAPTHTGSLCLFCAAITYFVAARNGENGNPVEEKKGRR
jgi:hypothetical protein